MNDDENFIATRKYCGTEPKYQGTINSPEYVVSVEHHGSSSSGVL